MKTIIVILLVLGFISCQVKQSNDISEITILFTSDEHGWYEPSESNSGFPGIAKQWNELINTKGRENILILSGGDNFTGYAPSNITKGENMVKIMNKMDYDFSTIGNHEFDFSINELKKRINEADYEYLSANTYYRANGKIADFVKPYAMKKVGNSLIAIIGLSNINTAKDTYPPYVSELEFMQPCSEIKKLIGEINSYKPDLIIALTHEPSSTVEKVMPCIDEFNIDIVLCGHSHEKNIIKNKEYVILESGSHLNTYGRIDVKVDNSNDYVIEVNPQIIENKGELDVDINKFASEISSSSKSYLDVVIGKVDSTYKSSSIEVTSLLAKAWLKGFGNSEFIMINRGGMRQSLFKGYITNGDIMGIIPFENKILEVDMKGYQIIKEIEENHSNYFPSDFNIENEKSYKVLINSYMYYSDSDFQTYDTEPQFFEENYRIPVLKWVAEVSDSGKVSIDYLLKN